MGESRNLTIYEKAIQELIDSETECLADIEKFWVENRIDPEDYEINITETENRISALEDALEAVRKAEKSLQHRLCAVYEEYGVGYR